MCCPSASEKSMYNIVSTLAPIFFILIGKKYDHKISNEFEFHPDLTTVCGVNCLERRKNSRRLLMGEMS